MSHGPTVLASIYGIGLGIVLLSIVARPANAEGTRIAIYVEGPAKDSVHKAIVSSLPDDTADVAADRSLKAALPLKRAFRGPPRTLSNVLKKSAQQLDADVIVVALAETKLVKLLAVDANGEVLAEGSVRGAKPKKLAAEIDAVLGPVWTQRFSSDGDRHAAPVASSSKASPAPVRPSGSTSAEPSPAAPEPKPSPPPTSSERDELAVARTSAVATTPFWQRWSRSLISVTAELGSMARIFRYNDKRSATLATHEQPVAPHVGLVIAVYPVQGRLAQGLGAYGRFGRSLDSTANATNEMTTLRNRSTEIEGGLRYRTALGRSLLVGSLGAGKLRLQFEDTEMVSAAVLLPHVSYTYLRPALDLRVPLSRFAVVIGGGYRHVLASDGIRQAFAKLSVGGVDASTGIAVALSSSVSMTLAIGYVRFFYDLKPDPGDPFIAGGALDEYFHASLGASYAY